MMDTFLLNLFCNTIIVLNELMNLLNGFGCTCLFSFLKVEYIICASYEFLIGKINIIFYSN
jgi:hypothetical protein